MKGKSTEKTWRVVRPPLAPTFDVPERSELLDVFAGDSVKLIFEDDDGFGERMWVNVTKCGNLDDWEGWLDNTPVGRYTKPRLRYRSKVKFHPYDIITILPHRRIDQLESEAEPVLNDTENKIVRMWYKDPQYLVPIAVALIGAISTLIASTL